MPAQDFPAKRLSRDEFASAIQKGLGRAMLHVMHHGVDDVADLVLDACLHNYTYDTQCEDGQSEWLFEMISKFTEYANFREAILNGLDSVSIENDLAQICEMVALMGKHGDTAAREALRARVFADAVNSTWVTGWAGPSDWIDLAGIPGLVDLARVYGQRLLANPEDSVPQWLSIFSEDETEQVLARHAHSEPEINAYYEFLKKHRTFGSRTSPAALGKAEQVMRRRYYRNEFRQKHTLKGVLQNAVNKVGDYPGDYYRFGKYARSRELKVIYKRMLAETDPAVQVRLLWVFRGAVVPYLDDILFEWAKGSDAMLRSAAIAALSKVINPAIHELARSKLASLELIGDDNESLGLFLYNYEPDDAALIAQALDSIHPNPEDAHSLGFGVIHLAEKYISPGLAPALFWVYENDPCANCRLSAIEQLSRIGQFTDAIRHECLHDADEDIREFANGK